MDALRMSSITYRDVSTCVHCGSAVRIVASIEGPNAIRAILGHFQTRGLS